MDLNLSDEQRLLRESAERFVAASYDADHRRKTAKDPLGFSPEVWKQFAELGWLALPIPEEFGGLGGGPVEIGILMDAFGRGLVSEPYIATVVLGAALIERCGGTAQKQANLPKIADGTLKLALRAFRACRAVRSCQGRDIGDQDGTRLAPHRQQDRRARRPCGRRDHRLSASA
ncbi:alkylation response protein AidB-like acyl-CoA dehydrogenase [Bradyrhizobium sp. USDA 4472]